MRMPRFVSKCLMAIACRTRQAKGAGLIINEHTLTASETRLHIDTLSRWFDFIHHDQLVDRLARPKARPFCLLTFDDGKRSNFTESAPELERLGVPAVFYVPTRFLTEGTSLWFDRYDAIRRFLGYTPPGLERWTLKQLPLALINDRLDKVCTDYKVVLDLECDDVRPMSWDDARELSRRGFTIGAHGLRHAMLPRETEDVALSEIEQSLADVSSELGTQCRTFAFPNGNYTGRLARYCLESGAQTVMTTDPMWADNRFPLWRLPRVLLNGANTRSKIELKVALAATGRFLENPDGTGWLYRKNRIA